MVASSCGRFCSDFCSERASAGVLDVSSAYTMAYGGIQASACIHEALLNTTLRLCVLFFEQNPLGRILNRFSDDMATVDFVLPFTIRSMINCVLQMAATLGVIGVITPVYLATVPPLALGYYTAQVDANGLGWGGALRFCPHWLRANTLV